MLCPYDGQENDAEYCFSFNHGEGCKELKKCYRHYDLDKIRQSLGILGNNEQS